jgi:hypothetical protein
MLSILKLCSHRSVVCPSRLQALRACSAPCVIPSCLRPASRASGGIDDKTLWLGSLVASSRQSCAPHQRWRPLPQRVGNLSAAIAALLRSTGGPPFFGKKACLKPVVSGGGSTIVARLIFSYTPKKRYVRWQEHQPSRHHHRQAARATAASKPRLALSSAFIRDVQLQNPLSASALPQKADMAPSKNGWRLTQSTVPLANSARYRPRRSTGSQ